LRSIVCSAHECPRAPARAPEKDREVERIDLLEYRDETSHGYVADLRPGQMYGYRAHDPYARAHIGALRWDPAVFGYQVGDPRADLSFDSRDSAPFVPKCVVVDPDFDWRREARRHAVPWERTIVYEAHVRGYTRLHPELAERERGTFRGLAHPQVVEYIRSLGVTTVELLPVHTFIDDEFLLKRNLTNYWGYNSIGFFAPDPRYAADAAKTLQEFKEMVARFHDAGLEVVIDVVYNHTAEGSELGPTLSFKGIAKSGTHHDSPRSARRRPMDSRRAHSMIMIE